MLRRNIKRKKRVDGNLETYQERIQTSALHY